jgi:hypothetical protein
MLLFTIYSQLQSRNMSQNGYFRIKIIKISSHKESVQHLLLCRYMFTWLQCYTCAGVIENIQYKVSISLIAQVIPLSQHLSDQADSYASTSQADFAAYVIDHKADIGFYIAYLGA